MVGHIFFLPLLSTPISNFVTNNSMASIDPKEHDLISQKHSMLSHGGENVREIILIKTHAVLLSFSFLMLTGDRQKEEKRKRIHENTWIHLFRICGKGNRMKIVFVDLMEIGKKKRTHFTDGTFSCRAK